MMPISVIVCWKASATEAVVLGEDELLSEVYNWNNLALLSFEVLMVPFASYVVLDLDRPEHWMFRAALVGVIVGRAECSGEEGEVISLSSLPIIIPVLVKLLLVLVLELHHSCCC
jgi:hypothetical protein